MALRYEFLYVGRKTGGFPENVIRNVLDGGTVDVTDSAAVVATAPTNFNMGDVCVRLTTTDDTAILVSWGDNPVASEDAGENSLRLAPGLPEVVVIGPGDKISAVTGE